MTHTDWWVRFIEKDTETDKCTCDPVTKHEPPFTVVCPYQAEIHDVTEPTCNCCDYCQDQCTWDI